MADSIKIAALDAWVDSNAPASVRISVVGWRHKTLTKPRSQAERCHVIFNAAQEQNSDVIVLFNVKGGLLPSLFSGSGLYSHALSGSHDSGTYVLSKHPLTKLMWQPFELSSTPLLHSYSTSTELGVLHVQVSLPSGGTVAVSAPSWCPTLPTPLHKDHPPLAAAHRAVQCVDTIMQVATVQAQAGEQVPHLLVGPLHSANGGAECSALQSALLSHPPSTSTHRRSSYLTKHITQTEPPCTWMPPSTAPPPPSPWPEGPLSPPPKKPLAWPHHLRQQMASIPHSRPQML